MIVAPARRAGWWPFRAAVDCSDYSTGPMPMAMDSAMQSIENCSVGLSAHFHAFSLMQLTVKPGRVGELARVDMSGVYVLPCR
ncbi:hypothetical protein [Burkholderia ambifaria]|uniref:hypothetical protein n=1 Tax=Burkholderia ambifaria TaxID=152480 RepID=UPI0015886371|nr:hypothetical protein [Burkholderia ambifaria]